MATIKLQASGSEAINGNSVKFHEKVPCLWIV